MPRLSKVTKELNVGLQTCVDFLQKKGYAVENSLNAKIDDEQYELLVMQFSQDKDLRQKAEKAQRDRIESRKEAKAANVEETPEVEAAPAPVKEEKAKLTFKVIGKIDLDGGKKTEPVVPVVEEKAAPVVEEKVVPAEPVQELKAEPVKDEPVQVVEEVKVEEPLSTTYRGVTVYKLPMWQQGPALLQALNLLEDVDLRAMGYKY